MAIVVNLDVMLARRKMRVGELADRIGISLTNLSLLKTGKVKAGTRSFSVSVIIPKTLSGFVGVKMTRG